jgi:hypothetical protein
MNAAAVSALWYLQLTSLAGRVKSRLARLRQPKYLAGAVVGAIYVYLVFFQRTQNAHGSPLTADQLALFAEIAAFAVLVILVVNWCIPRHAALSFTEAEIAFLFPAPLSRRTLIHYRLLSAQVGIVITALIFTLVFRSAQSFSGGPWSHAVGWWLVLATLRLHFTATGFTYSRFLNRSITTTRRRIVILGIVTLLCGTVVSWAWRDLKLPVAGALESGEAFRAYFTAQLRSGPFPWLLAIPQWLLAPYFATTAREFWQSLPWALLVLAAHYVWVLRVQVAFEEASIARAERVTVRRTQQQSDWRGQASRKARRPAFTLASRGGRPEVALLWKNFLALSVFWRARTLVIALTIILLGSFWLAQQAAFDALRLGFATSLATFLIATLLIGPSFAAYDLRADLPNADLLKTYPLHGWQIVLGELLTPLVLLTVLIWLSALALLLVGAPLGVLTPLQYVGIAVALALLAPLLVTIQLLAPNAIAVCFPAWIQSTSGRAERGIELIGQRIILLTTQLLVASIALLPAAAIAAGVFLLVQWLLGFGVAAILATLTLTASLTLIAGFGIRWLGKRFEQLDIAAELRN